MNFWCILDKIGASLAGHMLISRVPMTSGDPRGLFWEVLDRSCDPPSLQGSMVTESPKEGQKWPYKAKMTIFDPKIGQKVAKSVHFGPIWPLNCAGG